MAKLAQNDNVGFKRRLNVGGIAAAVERLPDELAGFEKDLERITPLLDLMDGDEIGVIHGDFWTGKYVISIPLCLLPSGDVSAKHDAL